MKKFFLFAGLAVVMFLASCNGMNQPSYGTVNNDQVYTEYGWMPFMTYQMLMRNGSYNSNTMRSYYQQNPSVFSNNNSVSRNTGTSTFRNTYKSNTLAPATSTSSPFRSSTSTSRSSSSSSPFRSSSSGSSFRSSSSGGSSFRSSGSSFRSSSSGSSFRSSGRR